MHSIRGQSLTGLLVSSVIGIIVLLGVTDVLNHLSRTQRGGEMTMEFTTWKTTLAGLVKSPDQCSAALSGSPTEPWASGTAAACECDNDANYSDCGKVSWPAGCTNTIYTNKVDCEAALGAGAWTGKVWLEATGVAKNRGLEVSALCIKRGVESGTYLGHGANFGERVYNSVILLEAAKAADQMGSATLQSVLYVTLVVRDSDNTVLRCASDHDRWQRTTIAGNTEPQRRLNHAAAWTGSQMVVWGGVRNGSYDSDGKWYDPVNDAWTALAAAPAWLDDGSIDSRPRAEHSMTWTGNLILIFGGWKGGVPYNNGARYYPGGNAWTRMATTPSSAVPTPRRGHTAVWTGAKMLIWGGLENGGTPVNTGSIYDPEFDKWEAMTPSGLTARSQHTAVWDGINNRMIVWGGMNAGSTALNDGASFDVLTNTWSAIPNATTGRRRHSAVWAIDKMIVWGGDTSGGASASGEKFIPGTGWLAINLAAGWEPPARSRHTAVWTGKRMLVWGGADGATLQTAGGSYDPATDKWSDMWDTTVAPVPPLENRQPEARVGHTAVWTGSQMIIWGGDDGSDAGYSTGARYTPP